MYRGRAWNSKNAASTFYYEYDDDVLLGDDADDTYLPVSYLYIILSIYVVALCIYAAVCQCNPAFWCNKDMCRLM